PKLKLPSISKNVSWNDVTPTFSMSPVRRHFWQVAARVKLGSPRPMNSRLNWFIPAGVESTVGSLGTSRSLGLRTQPFEAKKSRYASRSSSVVMSGAGYRKSGMGGVIDRVGRTTRSVQDTGSRRGVPPHHDVDPTCIR